MSKSKTIPSNIIKSHITQTKGLSLDRHIFFRRWLALLLIAAIAYPLGGCLPEDKKQDQMQAQPQITPSVTPSSTINAKPTSATLTNPVRLDLAQFLPVGARVTVSNDTVKDLVLDLEVARTPEQQSKGLMYRPALAANRGMLFSFSPAQVVAFWMKNVPVDLDMIFLSQGKIVAIATAIPCVAEPCALYPSNQGIAVDQVIELRAGRARELGLKEGDSLTVELLETTKP
ncbi:MAG: DUF192 domain-containing protein [Pseudanabaena sp. ELA607]